MKPQSTESPTASEESGVNVNFTAALLPLRHTTTLEITRCNQIYKQTFSCEPRLRFLRTRNICCLFGHTIQLIVWWLMTPESLYWLVIIWVLGSQYTKKESPQKKDVFTKIWTAFHLCEMEFQLVKWVILPCWLEKDSGNACSKIRVSIHKSGQSYILVS